MIHDNVLQQVISLLTSYPGVEEIYLFGSRSNGTASERSDYDIAIRTTGISDKEFNLLALQVQEEVFTLHKIDIVHLNTLSNPVLLDNIVHKGQLLFKRVPQS